MGHHTVFYLDDLFSGHDAFTVEAQSVTDTGARRVSGAIQGPPRTHLLSNGSYTVMLTAAGSGYSRWRDLALTRWREDPTRDPWGSYLVLRDVVSGEVWSAGFKPTGREPDSYDVAFFEDRAQFSRQDGQLRTILEVMVSSDDDAELRLLSLINEGRSAREIDVTSYAEVVLSPPAADTAHPAFSKMFVQTEFVAEQDALLATRRPRDPGPQYWMVHFCALQADSVAAGLPGAPQFETDRARFLGRGRDIGDAAAIKVAGALSNTAGTVLDPVLSLRRRVRIDPGATVRAAFWTGIAAGRAPALSLVEKLRRPGALDLVRTQSSAQAESRLRDLGASVDDTRLFQDIAGHVLYSSASLRAPREILDANGLGQSTLWAHGVSGDLPIVLGLVENEADVDMARDLLRARRYWQSKYLSVDLVLLNAARDGAAAVQSALEKAVKVSGAGAGPGALNPSLGAVILLANGALPPPHLDLLKTAARALFGARRGSLREQVARPRAAALTPPIAAPAPPASAPVEKRPQIRGAATSSKPPAAAAPEFFNGLGGFDRDAREYVTVLGEDQWTPAPWINVIANPQFGFLVSADGTGSTWSLNAQQNQITPWSNDPVSNAPAEAIYIRDEDSGDLWSAAPLPIRDSSTYTTRHGFGYTRLQHAAHGISLDLLQFVPLEDPIKIGRLTIRNESQRARRLSITHYVDWVLGNQNNRAAPFIITSIEPSTGALLARNPWTSDFSSRVAFMDMAGRQQGYTADRTEFIGHGGSLAAPAALLGRQPLAKRVGGGLDPCGAMQTMISLNAGESLELTLFLGEESSHAAAASLIERYRAMHLDTALQSVTDFWRKTLNVIQVKTPDRSLDILANGWLLYQTLSCRVWGRTAFYQSSGAYGYRDQLQDVMALCVAAPAATREHILRAAARQFAAGDVQHWWLPTSGQGIQTRIADDRIWLVFVLARYLEVTQDVAVLDEPVPFLSGGPLAPGVLENFTAPASGGAASLFDHCVLALDSSLSVGEHGLPLFGTGDWNDGMNRVGIKGRGESVWLGWFLHAALTRFAPVAEARGAKDKAARWREHAAVLQKAIEREAWDGEWYGRGYYDDGTPLGFASDDECRIDSVAQSWAVISGAAQPDRAARAMASVDAQLVSRADGLVKLFTPPFDRTPQDPGYIKAYPPGLRENGGQYTHGAMWCALAFALLGDGDRAVELFALMNPINHSLNENAIERYKVEPYVVCADVYSTAPHIGRGGWTWYTGSAGWMYRTAVEGILGIHLRGAKLAIEPCIPHGWQGFEATYLHGSTRYLVRVNNPRGVNRGVARASLDGRELAGGLCEISLADDGREHTFEVTLG
jgi:cyclic beta-1,2-glucan glucanotransferase